MKKWAILFFVLGSMLPSFAIAGGGELDNRGAPQGLVVRDDGQGTRTVFQADGAQVTTDAQAAAAVVSFVNSANQIASVVPQSELDQGSSTGSWYYWYGYNNYYYGYYYYGYNYLYRPCYNWYYGGYNYSYYYYY